MKLENELIKFEELTPFFGLLSREKRLGTLWLDYLEPTGRYNQLLSKEGLFTAYHMVMLMSPLYLYLGLS